MVESIKRIVGPYQDSYSPNGIIGEKDACGVGFIANVKGCLLYTSDAADE